MTDKTPWYFGVDCDRCGSRIAFARDPSNGDTIIDMAGPGQVRLSCPSCGKTSDYPAAKITSRPGHADPE